SRGTNLYESSGQPLVVSLGAGGWVNHDVLLCDCVVSECQSSVPAAVDVATPGSLARGDANGPQLTDGSGESNCRRTATSVAKADLDPSIGSAIHRGRAQAVGAVGCQ